MSRKRPSNELFDYFLDQFNAPPTDAFQAEVDAAAKAIDRDERRHDALRKLRRTDIDDWIKKQLASDHSLKSPELWERAPNKIKDYLSEDAFKKRVTDVRKKRR